jgi:hypothetical protein
VRGATSSCRAAAAASSQVVGSRGVEEVDAGSSVAASQADPASDGSPLPPSHAASSSQEQAAFELDAMAPLSSAQRAATGSPGRGRRRGHYNTRKFHHIKILLATWFNFIFLRI